MTHYPPSTVLTQTYLTEMGYSPALIQKYLQSGWLSSIGHGVYIRQNEAVRWEAALAAIQQQLKKPIYAGGKTALSLSGIAHYAVMGSETVRLYGKSDEKIPKWFADLKGDWRLRYERIGIFEKSDSRTLTDFAVEAFTIKISTRERAIFEILSGIPEKQSFDEAFKLMEMLSTLRPSLLQNLLETVNSVKVKRLFLYMASKIAYPWYEELNLEAIDLGKGKRRILENGVLDKEYLITVPKETIF